MKSGDVSRPFLFKPGLVEVYLAPGGRINELLKKYDVPYGLITPVLEQPPTPFDVAAGIDRMYRVVVPPGYEKTIVTQLAKAKMEILYVGLLWITAPVSPGLSPNDDRYVNGYQGNLVALDMARAWDRTVSFNGVRIAVIDTGLMGTHEDTSTKQTNGYDYVAGTVTAPGTVNDFGCQKTPPDPDRKYAPGHGTQVAAIAAAATNNGLGIAGTGFNSVILPIRFYRDNCDQATTQGLAVGKAHDLLANVINMSFSGDAQDLIARNYFETGWTMKGIINVAAAGNDNTSAPKYPCAFPYVMCIGNSDNAGTRAPDSNYGTHVDYAAPGINIWSADRDSTTDYSFQSGTSFSAPQVSGIAGLFKSIGCTPDNAHQAIANTTSPHPDSAWTAFGFVNAGRALWYFPSC